MTKEIYVGAGSQIEFNINLHINKPALSPGNVAVDDEGNISGLTQIYEKTNRKGRKGHKG